MPFKSQRSGGSSPELLVEGKISNETFEEWNRETGGAKLPERVNQGQAKSKARARSKAQVQAPVEMTQD